MCSLGATWKAGKDILLEDTGAMKWWWEPGLMKVSVGRDRREDENQTGEPSFATCLPPGTPADLQDWETASYTELLITLVGLREQQQQQKESSFHTVFSCIEQLPPGSSIHGILQAGIRKWVAIPFSRASSQPRDGTRVSCIGRQILFHWATREAPCMQQILIKSLFIFILLQIFSDFSCYGFLLIDTPMFQKWTFNFQIQGFF